MDLLRCGENEIQCDNKKCVNKEFHCDGDNDCGDWSDEDTCPMLPGSCSAGEFKYLPKIQFYIFNHLNIEMIFFAYRLLFSIITYTNWFFGSSAITF